MVRGALAALLGLRDDIEVLGTAADGEAALTEVRRMRLEVWVSGIGMPALTGAGACIAPAARGLTVPGGDPDPLARPGDRRKDALRRVARGQRAVAPELAIELDRTAIRSTTASGSSCAWAPSARRRAKSPAG